MVWVKSEYAGELAVLSAWLSALLPWNLFYAGEIEGLPGSAVYLRFPFVQVRYLLGVPFADAVTVDSPFGARALSDPEWSNPPLAFDSVTAGYDLWILGAVPLLLAVALSVAMYAKEDRVAEVLPLPSVRVMGSLFALGTVLLTASTVQFYREEPFGGVPIPIGLIVLAILSGILLTVDLEQDGENGGPSVPKAGAAPDDEETDR